MTRRLLVILLCAQAAFGAAGAGMIWWVHPNGTSGNVNGGGFNPQNANLPTDLACTSATGNAPVCTSASYNFVSGDVTPVGGAGTSGGMLWIKTTGAWGGVGFLGCLYPIASVAANAATLDATLGHAWCLDTTAGYPSPHWTLSTAAGVANTGSPTGGTWGEDLSHGDLAYCGGTNLATDSASNTKVSSASCAFGVNFTANSLQVESAGSGGAFTQGWFEIVSVSGGVATIDRTNGTTTGAGGTFKVGGSISLASTTTNRTDNDFFSGGHVAVGQRFMVSGNTSYSIGQAVTTAGGAGATTQTPITIEGYASYPGDTPTGSTRPTFAIGATIWTSGANVDVYNMIYTGIGGTTYTMGSHNKVINCKIANVRAAANGTGLAANVAAATVIRSELVSLRGPALTTSNSGTLTAFGNYIHDSDIGIQDSVTSNNHSIIGNIICCNVTNGVKFTAAVSSGASLIGNTLYGAENKIGTGLSFITGASRTNVLNNIFYGFVTGISHADAQTSMYSDWNDMYNNTNDVSSTAQYQRGSNGLSLDPQFTAATQITNATFTTGTCGASDNTLTVSGANFTNAGVVAGRDYVYISGGTNATVGKYGIVVSPNGVGTTTLALDNDCSSTSTASAITWQITLGRNFAIGTNLKAMGFPGAFPAGYTTGYLDIGAAQRQETGGSGGQKAYSFVARLDRRDPRYVLASIADQFMREWERSADTEGVGYAGLSLAGLAALGVLAAATRRGR